MVWRCMGRCLGSMSLTSRAQAHQIYLLGVDIYRTSPLLHVVPWPEMDIMAGFHRLFQQSPVRQRLTVVDGFKPRR